MSAEHRRQYRRVYSHYDEAFYGVPIRYALASGEAGGTRLDVLRTTSISVRTSTCGRQKLHQQVRAPAYANYRHFELEGGWRDRSTTFYNKGFEGRLELVQANRGGWQGASGVRYCASSQLQRGRRRAFLPQEQYEPRKIGLFTLCSSSISAKLRATRGRIRYEHGGLSGNHAAGDALRNAAASFDAISGIEPGLSMPCPTMSHRHQRLRTRACAFGRVVRR